MGIYRDRVFPRVLNTMMNTKEARRIRADVCAPLSGTVLEIGFGTGLNLPHMPTAVIRLLAVDPMERGRDLAAERIAATTVPVEFVGLDGGSIPVEDGSMDAVLATWTLCTVPDPSAAMAEVRRVLRPGGMFHFVEHGRSPDEKVRKWQDRMNGVQKRIAVGCNLNRDIPAAIEAGGLAILDLQTYYAKGEPKATGWTFQGVAAVA